MNDFLPLFKLLLVLFLPAFVAVRLLKRGKGGRRTLNARCGKAFLILYCKVWAAKNREDLAEVEGQVDDFYNDYACKAVSGLTYANELYCLIAEIQMQMSKNETHVLS